MLYEQLRALYPEYEGMSDTERYALADQLFYQLQENIDEETRTAIEQLLMFLHGRLALHVYHQARHRFLSNPRIDDNDLEQAAFEGLLLAIRSFDPSLQYKFSSYAVKTIQSNINRLEQQVGSDLHISHAAIGLMNKVRVQLHSDEELAERLSAEAAEDRSWTESTLQSILRLFTAPIVSLYRRIHNDRFAILDIVPDEDADTETTAIDNVQMEYYEQQLRQVLSDVEFDVITRYYGLFGRNAETLREIAASYGVSKQAIHQLRDRALFRVKAILRHG